MSMRLPGRGAGGVTWVNFCCACAAGISETLPHYSLFCGHIIVNSILVTLGKKYSCNLNLVTFCLCIYLVKSFNLVTLK